MHSTVSGPFGAFSAAYYLLPGAYDWEDGSRKELLTVGLLPVAGVAGFALFTDRLAPASCRVDRPIDKIDKCEATAWIRTRFQPMPLLRAAKTPPPRL